ncbi:MAG TPA: CoA pyrophosphatase [Chloroflexota bacterium]|nr:CoA pyrophosphatase [Chloroflexota bacterium]
MVFPVIERPATLTRHPGQVALPGGAWEAADSELWATALRETREELGVATDGIQPIGRLEPIPVTVSRFVIYPFAGWIERLAPPQPDPAEVALVAQIPLRALLDPGNVHEEERGTRQGHSIVTYYDIAGLKIWGATARILSDLASHLGAPDYEYPPGWVRPA